MTTAPVIVPEESRDKKIAAAQPVRLISIDEVSTGELVILLFKLVLASIPVTLVVGGVWYFVSLIVAAMRTTT